jgi:hypothetical protein
MPGHYTETDRHRAAFMAGRCESCGYVKRERLSPHPKSIGTLTYTMHRDACPRCFTRRRYFIASDPAPR